MAVASASASAGLVPVAEPAMVGGHHADGGVVAHPGDAGGHRPCHIGTGTVTSSVTRVGDDAAVGMMTAYHRLLAAGTRPAEALAEATATEPFSPFVCFGGG